MTSTISQAKSTKSTAAVSEVSITALLKEIQETPREYWSKLLQMIQLFRETATFNQGELSYPDLTNLETELLNAQHQALKELNQEWIEEGDKQEQIETLEYLQQNLK